jgi:hypothetical protein
MSFVAAGTFIVGDAAAASMGALATGMIGGALVGAGSGALINGLTGRSVLNGALIGGALGAGGGALGGAAAGFGASSDAGMMTADATSQLSAGVPASQVSATLQSTYGIPAAQADSIAASAASSTASSAASTAAAAAPTVANAAGAQPTPTASTSAYSAAQEGEDAAYGAAQPSGSVPTGTGAGGNTYMPQGATPSSGFFDSAGNWISNHAGLTATGLGLAYLMSRPNAMQPNYISQYTPTSASSMGLGRTMAAGYQPTRAAAEGGIMKLAAGGATDAQSGLESAGITGLQGGQQQQQTQSVTPQYIQQLASEYGITLPPQHAAKGGAMGGDYNLGGYSDGGRLLKGPGDGMSDDIPASIADKQPARLADGEFVVPADVVSHLGNGSTDAGAKHLYSMMDNVRKARTGNKKQGKQIKADKFLPK